MPRELYHYGVIGMKWGQHKARAYARDVNKHRYTSKVKQLTKDAMAKKVSMPDYKHKMQKYTIQYYKNNAKTDRKIGKVKLDKNAKVSSIYEKYKSQAVKEIPNYKLKRGAKLAGKAIYNIGSAAINVNPTVAAGRIGLKIVVNNTAKAVAKKVATTAGKSVAYDIGQRLAEQYIYEHEKKKGGSSK